MHERLERLTDCLSRRSTVLGYIIDKNWKRDANLLTLCLPMLDHQKTNRINDSCLRAGGDTILDTASLLFQLSAHLLIEPQQLTCRRND